MNEPDHIAALIQTLGAHAVLLFAVMLLVLLAGMSMLWWLARRYTFASDTSRLPPGAYLLIRLAAGFAVLLGAALVFAEIAEELGDGERIGELDETFSGAVRASTTRAVVQGFAWITRLADPLALALIGFCVGAVLLWRGRRWLALSWVLALAGNAVLNPALKAIFARARPVHDEALIYAHGFSFPSGHSSGAVVTYGMLAYVVLRCLPQEHMARIGLPVVLAASAAAFSIGCSRVFLQVHYASDVLAGFASGTAWLTVCIVSIELTRHYRQRAA